MKLPLHSPYWLALLGWIIPSVLLAQTKAPAPKVDKKLEVRLAALKKEAVGEVEKRHDVTQQMNDMIFSFAELGFQEFETSKYLTDILEKNGFTIERGISGVPTAWMARWGSGEPVIALGSDLDCIPKASQKPGVAYHDPIVEGAPGHGEGHNSGQALNVTAALVVKQIMEREKIGGTLVLWPGVAEELVGTKAYFVRDGYFKDIDAVIFTHVSDNLSVSYGEARGTGLVSVEFMFEGEAAHAAGNPWRGKSALDAAELMNVGWNFKREHLPLSTRTHYVIKNGGDQPNVVPSKASVWYYLRDTSYPGIKYLYDEAIKVANGAAMMTNTTMSYRILGTAWPRHFNKVIAETVYGNITQVGLPTWSEADQTLATALQKELGNKQPKGLNKELEELGMPVKTNPGGGSDDIADISWAVPTVTLGYPSNIPDLPGHHWANAVSMATPIAHKGLTAGAKVMAMSLLDMFLKPQLVNQAWDYYKEVQTKEAQYISFLNPEDKPATYLNQEIMEEYRPKLKPFYFDPTKYKTYLEQLGIQYPTVREQK